MCHQLVIQVQVGRQVDRQDSLNPSSVTTFFRLKKTGSSIFHITFTAQNAKNSPNFLVFKFFRNAQFSQNFWRFANFSHREIRWYFDILRSVYNAPNVVVVSKRSSYDLLRHYILSEKDLKLLNYLKLVQLKLFCNIVEVTKATIFLFIGLQQLDM